MGLENCPCRCSSMFIEARQGRFVPIRPSHRCCEVQDRYGVRPTGRAEPNLLLSPDLPIVLAMLAVVAVAAFARPLLDGFWKIAGSMFAQISDILTGCPRGWKTDIINLTEHRRRKSCESSGLQALSSYDTLRSESGPGNNGTFVRRVLSTDTTGFTLAAMFSSMSHLRGYHSP